jgi:uncharacterized membrane protein YdjX (TVP38/TMEM64 family)
MIFNDFQQFLAFLQHTDKFTAFFYLFAAKVVSSIFFLPVSPFTVLEGIVFGVFLGTILSIVGSLSGATISFFISRYLFKNFAKKYIFQKYPQVYDIEKKLFTRGFHTVFVLRLFPIFPFSLMNYILGVTDVKFKDYFLGSMLGMLEIF